MTKAERMERITGFALRAHVFNVYRRCVPCVPDSPSACVLKPALTWDYTACGDKSGTSPRPMAPPAEAVGAVTRSALILTEDVAP